MVTYKSEQDTQETDDMHTPTGGTELGKKLIAVYYKSPLGRIPDCMNKAFQHSAGAYMLSYSKGSDIPVYCRVCPKSSFPSYHKKGMLPRLQGTIKLKALSRLFGRMPRLQGCSAQADRPVCRHISATLLTLHRAVSSQVGVWVVLWQRSSLLLALRVPH